MWPWKRQPPALFFPLSFRAQRIGVPEARSVAQLPPVEIAAFFASHPEVARALVSESADKRYEPSSFISEQAKGWSVGWYSRHHGTQCRRHFAMLPDAATDYLLFSLGKGRWSPSDASLT